MPKKQTYQATPRGSNKPPKASADSAETPGKEEPNSCKYQASK